MEILILGLTLFFSVHVISTIPALKGVVTSYLKGNAYKAVYSIIALIGFVLIVMGYGDKPLLAIPEWQAPNWARHLMFLVLWVAIVLQPAAHMPTNIKRYTRHPMLWGVTLWAAMHLWVNSDQASILLFGSFLIYSVWAMLGGNMRGAKKQTQKVSRSKDVMVLLAGTVAYVVIILCHKWIAGVPLVNI